jgi:ribonuclease HI
VYFDGSCKPSPIRDLARAACAIIEVNRSGVPVRTIEATVPWDLPQTAQCAEHLAMAMGYHHVARQAAFVGDCLNVVRAMDGKSRKALAPTSRYAGLVLATHSHPEKRRLVTEVRWTKAHRTATGHEDAQESLDIRANALADNLAKSAVELHAPLGPLVDSLVQFYVKRAPLVVKAVAAALECFPPAPRGLPRVPPPRK